MKEGFEKRVELVAWLQNPDKNWDAEDSASCGARGCFSELSSAAIHYEEVKEILETKSEINNLFLESIKNGLTTAVIDTDGTKYFGFNENALKFFEAFNRARDNYKAKKETIFKETSGRGHGAVLDQSCFEFSIDNLSRASTLFLCGPQYADHLQQSLRRATAERGFHLPSGLEGSVAEELMDRQFKFYDKMQTSGVPAEDARYILPLYTRTTIQTKIDARELMHLHSMAQRKGVPSEVKETIEEMVLQATNIAPRLMANRETNYEVLAWMPSSQLFAEKNETIKRMINKFSSQGYISQKSILVNHSIIPMSPEAIEKAIAERDESEIANLKHYHFTFLAPMSLACFHQATRQRTWDQSVQPIYHSMKIGKYVTPPSIARSEFAKEYAELTEQSLDYVKTRLEEKDIIGVVPHSLIVHDLIHVNGWNAIHSIGKRTCTEAQWEIRGIARQMASYIKDVAPEIGKYAVPQGKIYGKCPEKKSCGLCDRK